MNALENVFFSQYGTALNYFVDDVSLSNPLQDRLGLSPSECTVVDIDYSALSSSVDIPNGHKIILKLTMIGRSQPRSFRIDCLSSLSNYPLRSTAQGEMFITLDPSDVNAAGRIIYKISMVGESPFTPDLDENGDEFLVDSFFSGDDYILFYDLDTAICRKPIVDLSISCMPNKLAYKEGEFFNPAGLSLSVTYNDGETEDGISIGYTHDKNGFPLSVGDSVAVEYEGIYAVVPVHVESSDLLYSGCSTPSETEIYAEDIFEEIYSSGCYRIFAHPDSGRIFISFAPSSVGRGNLEVPVETLMSSDGTVITFATISDGVSGSRGSYTYNDGVKTTQFEGCFRDPKAANNRRFTLEEVEGMDYEVLADGDVLLHPRFSDFSYRVREHYESRSGLSLAQSSEFLKKDYLHYGQTEIESLEAAYEECVELSRKYHLYVGFDSSYPQSLDYYVERGDEPRRALERFIADCRRAFLNRDDAFILFSSSIVPVGNIADEEKDEAINKRDEMLDSLKKTLDDENALAWRVERLRHSQQATCVSNGIYAKAFNINGLPIGMADNYGNSLNFNYVSGHVESLSLNGSTEAILTYAEGLLASIRHNDGSVTNFSYCYDKLTSVAHGGDSCSLSYEGGDLSSVSFNDGTVVRFGREGDATVASVERLSGKDIIAKVSSGTLGFTFELDGKKSIYRKSNGKIELYRAEDEDGILLDYVSYDSDGNCARQLHRSRLGKTTLEFVDNFESSLENGITIVRTKDYFDRVVSYLTTNIPEGEFDSVRQEFFYDGYELAGSRYVYSKDGNVVRETSERTRTDPSGRVVERTMSSSRPTEAETVYVEQYEYDEHGYIKVKRSRKLDDSRLSSESEYAYDGWGNLLSRDGVEYRYFGKSLTRRYDSRTNIAASYWYGRDGMLDSIDFAGVGGLSSHRSFAYDERGRISSVQGDGLKVNYLYNDVESSSSVSLLGHSHDMQTSYDGDDTIIASNEHGVTTIWRMSNRCISIEKDGALAYRSDLDRNGNTVRTTDYLTGQQKYIYRDKASRIVSAQGSGGSNESFEYDDRGRVILHEIEGLEYGFAYDDSNKTQETNVAGIVINRGLSDELNTVKSVAVSGVVISETTVCDALIEGRVSGLPGEVRTNGGATRFEYDEAGRMLRTTLNGYCRHSYEYDGFGRLICETDHYYGTSTSVRYDACGNIIQRKTTSTFDGSVIVAHTMTYDCNVLRTIDGEDVLNDEYGRPTLYRGNGIVWINDRPVRIGANEFSYDSTGRRVSKNSMKYKYDIGGKLISDGELTFIYDGDSIEAIKCDDQVFVLIKDAVGNVSEIVDSSGSTLAKYRYDVYGKPFVMNPDNTENTDRLFIGNVNPIRYRGYYYDVETGLYWLSSRYYDPEIGRFISPDSLDYLDPTSINGLNLYAYCNNDPVNNVDPTGHFAITAAVGLSTAAYYAIIALLAVASAATIGYAESKTHFISNTIEYVAESVDNALDEIKDKIIEYATSLATKRDYNSFEKHHIVAKRDPRAWLSRIILNKSEIDINDPRNLVYIKKGYHRVLHTNFYYVILNASIGTGYLINGSEGVEDVLDFYQKVLGGL